MDNTKPERPLRRYEVMWEREPSLAATVEEAWSRRIPVQDLGDVHSSMKSIMSSMYSWKMQYFKSVPRELEKRRNELESLLQASDEESLEKKAKLTKEMDEILYREEIMWLQRSRGAWLREGDQNTKYFHRRASWRRKKNRICKLKREDGTWTMDTHEMEGMAIDFFKKLYAREEDIQPEIITELLQQCVGSEINEKLCAPFTEKEISDTLFQIGPLKAPGPDGFPARFLQRNWDLLRDDVVRAVQRFFLRGDYAGGR
jgi:hypothetical protein